MQQAQVSTEHSLPSHMVNPDIHIMAFVQMSIDLHEQQHQQQQQNRFSKINVLLKYLV